MCLLPFCGGSPIPPLRPPSRLHAVSVHRVFSGSTGWFQLQSGFPVPAGPPVTAMFLPLNSSTSSRTPDDPLTRVCCAAARARSGGYGVSGRSGGYLLVVEARRTTCFPSPAARHPCMGSSCASQRGLLPKHYWPCWMLTDPRPPSPPANGPLLHPPCWGWGSSGPGLTISTLAVIGVSRPVPPIFEAFLLAVHVKGS